MKFRTEVDIPELKSKLNYRHQSMMIGSCFAENIGNYLEALCFPISVNPFGILYNPISIANSLFHILNGKVFSEKDLFFANNLYNSFSHHSCFSDVKSESVLNKINIQLTNALKDLQNSSHLFITFGTAWVFRHKISGEVVSNCHKLPANNFEKERLTVRQITEIWSPLITRIHKLNCGLKFVFTVSPIRHLKDGAHDNQLSKSALLLAIDQLISEFGEDNVSYFPAYEVVLDELRDYRFYASDMTHPSEMATQFIREKFSETMLGDEARVISKEISKLVLALNQKLLNNNRKEYFSFIESQIEKAIYVQNKYPFVDLNRLNKKLLEKRQD